MGKPTLAFIFAFRIFLKVTTKLGFLLNFFHVKTYIGNQNSNIQVPNILGMVWHIFQIAQLITKFILTMGILALVFVVAFQIIPKITTKFSFVPTKEKFNHFPELQDLMFT